MEVGSLVEAMYELDGTVMVRGKRVKIDEPIYPGELFTVCGFVGGVAMASGQTGLLFFERGMFVHPTLKTPCGYPAFAFREIQPPFDYENYIDNEKIKGVVDR